MNHGNVNEYRRQEDEKLARRKDKQEKTSNTTHTRFAIPEHSWLERRRARYAVSATRNSGCRFKGKASPRR